MWGKFCCAFEQEQYTPLWLVHVLDDNTFINLIGNSYSLNSSAEALGTPVNCPA